jgi:hypothetical protein
LTVRTSNPLKPHLHHLDELLVLLSPGLDEHRLPDLSSVDALQFRALTEPMPRPRERAMVLLAVEDLVALRQAATALGNYGTARRVGVWIERKPSVLPTPRLRPEWPPLDEVVASRSDQHFVLLTFAEPVPVRSVLVQVALSSTAAQSSSTTWPSVGARRDQPQLWPAADPAATIAMPGRLFDATVDSPPDVVRVDSSTDVPAAFSDSRHAVLGRAPVVIIEEEELPWEIATTDEEDVSRILRNAGPVSLGAVDEKVFNPIGFDRSPVGQPVPLCGRADGALQVEAGNAQRVIVGKHGRISDADVPLLRRLPGLQLDWSGGHGPQSYCRAVVSLACLGVPLTTTTVPTWAGHLLAQELCEALASPVDLTDRLNREEHSVRLRRAALHHHATGPWRRSLARANGLQETPTPHVSVLVVTRRPDMLGFALRQVARQRDAALEVVVAAHGFDPDPMALASFRDASSANLTALTADSSTLFGDVLNQAAARASGDVLLKMDDDDWYGPDFVSDLVLARGYSGAEVVGCAPEFTFLETLWLTTRRPDPSEVFKPFVAGGTMLIERAAFRSLGGFRETRKYVDANLLSGVMDAGGRVYRTHGLGYVLRRGGAGHTWDPGLGYFVSSARAPEQWRGFRPSALLELDSPDLPSPSTAERLPS